MSSGRCLVAMSGGVDSSVAAWLLKEEGRDLLGVSMQVWDYRRNGGCENKATCCSPRDFEDARLAAARINIPWYVFDMEKDFQEAVIDRFLKSYAEGLTPNPCIDCNNLVKFGELRKRAVSLNCIDLATGHYARIVPESGGVSLARGMDSMKDQSYFLYALSQEELQRTVFPLGNLTKPEVRELARKAGLPTAEKAESQDICFVQGGLQDFLKAQGLADKPGSIVDSQGRVLGRHDGIHNFTVGQRKGIGVGGSEEPLYVIELDVPANLVRIGSRKELERESFLVNQLVFSAPWILKKLAEADSPVEFDSIVQVRYRHGGLPARVKLFSSSEAEVRFTKDQSSVAPGQAAVFYDLDNLKVLGGGRITPQKLL